MAVAGPYSEADVDRIVRQRLQEREELIGTVVDQLKPQLDGMRREIAGANHVKRTLGRDLRKLTGLVEEHMRLRMHPGTEVELARIAKEIEQREQEFRLDEWSEEEMAALPEIAKDYVRRQQGAAQQAQQAQARSRWWETRWARFGIAVGALFAVVQLVNLVLNVLQLLSAHSHGAR